MVRASGIRASGICLEGPGFNPQSAHLFCLIHRESIGYILVHRVRRDGKKKYKYSKERA